MGFTATNTAAAGLSGTPALRGIKERMSILRSAAKDLFSARGSSTAATAPIARRPASRPAKRVKSEDSAAEASNVTEGDDDAAVAAPQNLKHRTVKKTSAKSNLRIKIEDIDASTATPTPAPRVSATGLPTPSTATGTSSGEKRKASSTTVLDPSAISESEEAMSTDAGEDSAVDTAGLDSPTPAAKKPRTSYSRASKAQQVTYAQLDGLESSDDDEALMAGSGAAAGAEWEKVLAERKNARKRAKVIKDDSDEDFFDS